MSCTFCEKDVSLISGSIVSSEQENEVTAKTDKNRNASFFIMYMIEVEYL